MSDFTEANRKAFDDLASTYNSKPWQLRISQQVSDALQQRKAWLGVQWSSSSPENNNNNDQEPQHQARLLDYACGTGAVTKALGDSVSAIRGIDISDNMVQRYNVAASSSGLSHERAHAVVGDLLAASGPSPAEALAGPDWYDFDVAVVGLGFHHFEDPALAAKRLTERLKPETGVLVIVDFLPFEGRGGQHQHGHGHGHSHGEAGSHSHSHSHPHAQGDGGFPLKMQQTIKHHGFTANGLQALFEAAGLEDFGFDVLPEPAVFDFEEGRKERTVFVAKGRRKAGAWGRVKAWFGGIQDVVGGQMAARADGKGEGAGAGGLGLRRDGQ